MKNNELEMKIQFRHVISIKIQLIGGPRAKVVSLGAKPCRQIRLQSDYNLMRSTRLINKSRNRGDFW